MTESFSSRWSPRLLSVLRIMAAFVFMAHGTQKLWGFPGAGHHPPFNLFTLFGTAGILETFGGSLLLLGLFTRPVAFILSGEMAVAYFKMHAESRLLADSQPRRIARAVLLPLAVPLRHRRRPVERGRMAEVAAHRQRLRRIVRM